MKILTMPMIRTLLLRNIAMRRLESPDFEYVYVRKPLKVAVPNLGDAQARKNPFNKIPRTVSLRETKQANFLSEQEAHEAAMLHSRTMFNYKNNVPCPRLDNTQVAQPCQLMTEVSDSLLEEASNWYTESDSDSEEDPAPNKDEECKEKIVKTETIASSLALPLSLISKEVEHNFLLIKKLTLATTEEVLARKVALGSICDPSKSKRKTLILDLDDTLIHTINPAFNYSSINVTHTDVKNILYQDGNGSTVFAIKVVIRPYAIQLLQELSSLYEIVVFLFFNLTCRSLLQLKNATLMQFSRF